MRILHLSRSDIGGAAKAAYRLHTSLLRIGECSRMFVLSRESDDPSVTELEPSRNVVSRVRRDLRRRRLRMELGRYTRPPNSAAFTDDRGLYGSDLLRQIPASDVTNLHWVARLLDYRSFFRVIDGHTPLVWRLADMAPFIGGCHYDEGCGRFKPRCGRCPQLASKAEEDLSRAIWQRKKAALSGLEGHHLHIVALSQWMANEVGRSAIFERFPITVIPNGVDIEELAPRDRMLARDVIGVPREAKVILFVAETVSNPRKGFDYLVRALSGISDFDGLFLVSVGFGRPEHLPQGIPSRHLGFIDNSRLLSLVYSAADLFVIPTLQDNFPNTSIEAMACGTPVLGFATGGLTDIVLPGKTGDLVQRGEIEALRKSLITLLQKTELMDQMRQNCRSLIVTKYSLNDQTRRVCRTLSRNAVNEDDR